MTAGIKTRARFGLVLLGAAMTAAGTAAGAQTAADPGSALSTNLRNLAANPNSISALMGAGKAALELGDAHAAITFFARAEELAPRDGRVKMWIGSALVQLEQPSAALKFFSDATSLGVTDAEIASDRGLAYDLLGDPARAQKDYAMALKRAPSAEVSRRMALSLAISGKREAALAQIADQLARQDRAARRTRALVLALTGDAAEATRAAQAAMPPAQATAMAPFLARLPNLSPAERAMAVHFGHFPGDGRTRMAQVATPGPTSPALDAGRPDSRQTGLGRRTPSPEPASTAARRRPGTEEAPATRTADSSASRPRPTTSNTVRQRSSTTTNSAARPAAQTPTRTAEAQPKPATPAVTAATTIAAATLPPAATVAPASTLAATTPAPKEEQPASTQTAQVQPQPSEAAPATTSASVPPASTPAERPGPEPLLPSLVAETQRPAEVAAAETTPPATTPAATTGPASTAPATTTAATTAPATGETVAPSSGLAELAAVVAALPETRVAPTSTESPAASTAKSEPDPKPAATEPKPTTAARTAPAKPAAAKRPASGAPSEQSRHWVQIAGGADKTALPREFARLKAKAPALLGSRSAWTVPLNATNRLLVGPFKTSEEAQEFVNQLAKLDLAGFTWTSPVGQAIEKLPAK